MGGIVDSERVTALAAGLVTRGGRDAMLTAVELAAAPVRILTFGTAGTKGLAVTDWHG